VGASVKLKMNNGINILGISAFFHDSAASLVRDGEIIAAAQEERFTRRKGDERFPRHAMGYCLEAGGVEVSDLDYVVFYESPLIKFDRLLETYISYLPEGWKSFAKAFPLWSTQRLRITREIRQQLGRSFRGKIAFTDHHLSHAASAFFPSPFEDAAILTLDAVGEWSTSSIGVGEGNRIRLLAEMRFPHSLGMLYSAFTYYTGFKVNSGEYKLMGLAPYGEPNYVGVIRDKLIRIHEDGSLWMNMDYFNYCQGLTMTSDRFHSLFGGPPRNPNDLITQKDMDLAASIQKITEEIVLKAACHAHRLTRRNNLVMAGGVALNCVANGKLLREGPFKSLWVQPAAGDAGGALGAALLAWHHHLDQPRTARPDDSQKGSLLGPSFGANRIQMHLDSTGAVYHHVTDEPALLDWIARLMAEENIIGWFHGRMEFGPRALGSRSIIGDARSKIMQQKMNLKIKYRESFRPFAPCVLREHAAEIFELEEGQESPYMLIVAPVRETCRLPLSEEDRKRMADPDLRIRVSVPRSTVPAITHVDYSARVQTVDEERHGRYCRLMKKFHELTGCPVIVNTSFNIRGEPIVCTPENAYRCFMATDMDCLVLEDFVLLKSEQPIGLLPNIEEYKDSIQLD
jgi:carbamoyltransferase